MKKSKKKLNFNPQTQTVAITRSQLKQIKKLVKKCSWKDDVYFYVTIQATNDVIGKSVLVSVGDEIYDITDHESW